MLRSKYIERICCIVMALCVLLTVCVVGAVQGGMIEVSHALGYENRLFDQGSVHTIDIVMDDWDSFIDTCENEEYAVCALVIDGESYRNVAIRAKGNTSLSSVAMAGNDRYSFKVEFDHYDSSITYHGLDKLSLNNIIQDSTYMKDYLAYTLMAKMGVAAPLCSYVQINVNGEPWGLYLAVEGVEDSFLARNYGSAAGELYKPDSLSFGGGRGNGKGFDIDALDFDFGESYEQSAPENMPNLPQGMSFEGFDPGNMDFGSMTPPGGMDFGNMTPPDNADSGKRGGGGGGMFGMGSSDVKLQYIDDDPQSYTNIFNNAKTDITDADRQRLIASLKALSEGDASVVDTDQVMRYLAIHHFLCNDDSYTGMMVHNYYLREYNGVLALIPWDYNLALGGFSGGMGGSGATSTVNSPIDTPVSMGSASDRPLIGWIWNSEESTAAYHAVYQEFMDTVFNNGWFAQELERVIDMIAPYVQADTNGFFSYEEFQTATSTLRAFCEKRVESLNGQLAGTIPSTSEGQRSSDALIDASEIQLSDMGGMNTGGFGGPGEMSFPGRGERSNSRKEKEAAPSTQKTTPPEGMTMPQGMTMPEGMTIPEGLPSAAPEAAPETDAPEESAAPQSRQNRKPQENGFDFGGMQAEPSTASWPWLLGSVALLLIGLITAKGWKGNM